MPKPKTFVVNKGTTIQPKKADPVKAPKDLKDYAKKIKKITMEDM